MKTSKKGIIALDQPFNYNTLKEQLQPLSIFRKGEHVITEYEGKRLAKSVRSNRYGLLDFGPLVQDNLEQIEKIIQPVRYDLKINYGVQELKIYSDKFEDEGEIFQRMFVLFSSSNGTYPMRFDVGPNNRSQKVMHDKFESLLQKFSFDKTISPLVKNMFLHWIQQKTEVDEDGKKGLQLELASLRKKLDNVEERFVTGEIDQTLYVKFRDKFRENIHKIESELDTSQNQLSNLEKAVDKCLKMSLELPSLWKKASFAGKQRIQNLLFPDGIHYNRKNDDYRTTRINLLFAAIPYLTGLVERYKNGEIDFSTEIPTWVGQRSEISNFYTDLKEVTNCDLNLKTPRKERERE